MRLARVQRFCIITPLSWTLASEIKHIIRRDRDREKSSVLYSIIVAIEEVSKSTS